MGEARRSRDARQQVARVGNNGMSTEPHLHFS